MIRNFNVRLIGSTVIAFVYLFCGLTSDALAKTNYKAFTPTKAEKNAFLKSDSKKLKYFEIEKNGSIEFDITGPAKIKIRTRAAFSGNAESVAYKLTIWEGNKVRAGRKAKTKHSKLTVDGSDNKIGLARDIFLDVPKGKHVYTVSFSSGEVDMVYARFYMSKPKKKKSAYESYIPYEFVRKEKLKSGKSVSSYYFIDENGGAKIKVIGPTKIKIYCRANFDPTIKEKSKFSFGVFEGEKSVKKFSAIADKSSKSVYTKTPELIPSTMHSFVLDVPGGEHIYEFKKLNSPSPNLAIRFLILSSSLGKKK